MKNIVLKTVAAAVGLYALVNFAQLPNVSAEENKPCLESKCAEHSDELGVGIGFPAFIGLRYIHGWDKPIGSQFEIAVHPLGSMARGDLRFNHPKIDDLTLYGFMGGFLYSDNKSPALYPAFEIGGGVELGKAKGFAVGVELGASFPTYDRNVPGFVFGLTGLYRF
jgi:hypothetical protein